MSIPSAKYLKKKASNRLQSGNDPKKVVLVYAGIVALSSLVVTVVQDLLDSQISQTGGIQNIGTRSMLTTADTVLTIAQLLLVMCLTLGYTGSMLRIARGQCLPQQPESRRRTNLGAAAHPAAANAHHDSGGLRPVLSGGKCMFAHAPFQPCDCGYGYCVCRGVAVQWPGAHGPLQRHAPHYSYLSGGAGAAAVVFLLHLSDGGLSAH